MYTAPTLSIFHFLFFQIAMYLSCLSLQMNIIVSSSRGGGLKEYLPSGTIVDVNPGGKLKVLKHKAVSLLPPPHRLNRKPHVYILGGVPDITELAKSSSPDFWYRESIFVHDSAPTIDKVKAEIMSCQAHIIKQGAVPIFCTIAKFNLNIYNNSLLKDGKTSILYHSDHYDDMQIRIDEVIDSVNDFIIKINRDIHMKTPCVHTCIKERRGSSGHGYYTYNWGLFKDGLHARPRLYQNWAKSLKVAFRKNRENEDSEEENRSPKRSWRREKRHKPNFE